MRSYDVTFSAPKSVSTLWALGDEHVAGESLGAHDAAVRAVLDFVERHATTRATVDGVVQNVDVDGLAVALFRQHTSRTLDPQLHTPTPSWPPRCTSPTEGGWPSTPGSSSTTSGHCRRSTTRPFGAS